ncbi:flagellar basal body-associated FliL family protein [Rugamonas apoptosis]|uniref:Flagellar protein FliL n=1 Tax=Rugamonas apoptosis TaxID=2758570 RepID=A0A7W2FBS4_9BURK|nr:flagellar basal body-associated FliL family protein [Rugamonas apoptosis]MBA5688822.1 flagellar basal body-associated FliL family protein [Rugamonas apoptosis]
MKNMKMIIAFVVVAVIGAGVAGGAVWYLSKGASAGTTEAKKAERHDDGKPPKYLTVEKVIIMLKRSPGDTATHYISADLVVTTSEEKEKVAKEQLPMLRSVAVRTLSALPLATAQTMTIDQYAAELNKAFDETYAHDKRDKPFSEVMIGKLILE